MNIGEDEVDQILRVVASILHIGNIKFQGTDAVRFSPHNRPFSSFRFCEFFFGVS